MTPVIIRISLVGRNPTVLLLLFIFPSTAAFSASLLSSHAATASHSPSRSAHGNSSRIPRLAQSNAVLPLSILYTGSSEIDGGSEMRLC